MEVAFIGLGRMGANMVRRLVQGGHTVVAYNRTTTKVDEIVKEGEGVIGAYSPSEVVGHPRETRHPPFRMA